MKVIGKIIVTILIIIVGGFLGMIINGINGSSTKSMPMFVTLAIVIGIGLVWKKKKPKNDGDNSDEITLKK